jgi:choline dehydrogenase
MLFKTVKENSNRRFDFIVVGAGSSGAVLASRLAQDPDVTVLLIEAGGKATELEAKIPIACGKLQQTRLDWEFTVEPSTTGASFQAYENEKFKYPCGKCLGGSSVLNYMAYVRGAKQDFDVWEKEFGAKGWGWKDVLPLFKKSEDNETLRLGTTVDGLVLDPEAHGVGGKLGVSSNPLPSPIPQAFVQGAVQCGFRNADYNTGEMENTTSIFQQTIRKGKRCDVATAFLFEQPSPQSNLTVVTYGHTTRLLFGNDGKTITGVEVADISPNVATPERYNIWSNREVILSGGTFGSPHILMLSGIGPKADLEKVGIDCVIDAPDVGRHMEDHPTMALGFMASKPDIGAANSYRGEGIPKSLPTLFKWLASGKGMLATSAYDATAFFKTEAFKKSNPAHGPDGQIGIFCGIGEADVSERNLRMKPAYNFLKEYYDTKDPQGVVILASLLHPVAKGTVELINSDPFTKPKIYANWLGEESDLKRLMAITRKALEIARSPAMQELISEPIYPPDLVKKHKGAVDSDAFLEEVIKVYAIALYHPTSTCKMGKVVDSRLCVKGVKGLRIADASVLPTIVSGNTNAVCIMVGEKAAELIKEDYGLKTVESNAPPQSKVLLSLVVAGAAVGVGLLLNRNRN